MSEPKAYKLIIKPLTESKAKFLRIFPMRKKSFLEGEPLNISFEIQNISEETFPGGMLYFYINWTSQQQVRHSFPIPPLEQNKTWITQKFETAALSQGFALIYINMPNIHDNENKSHLVEFYSGRRVENYIDSRASIDSIKVKTWEGLYEFWAMIISATGLLILALEKLFSFLS